MEKEKKNRDKADGGLYVGEDLEATEDKVDKAIGKLEKRYRHAFIANLLGSVVGWALAAAVVFLLVRQCT